MSTTRLTLLAPARDIQVGKAAIQAGADAIYIGGPQFGARAAAGNQVDDIAQLVAYAKPFGVKVLVTINTLLKADEFISAVQLAHDLYQAGVDALIIQDLALLKESLPPIRLHASTQCDNRTAEQVIRLQTMGFKRVVLARELSLDAIADIHQAAGEASQRDGVDEIELEAFVHGALCVSYSGCCYMSEELLDRSANRGCCAQMCRMRYDLLDEDGHEIKDDRGEPIHQRYLLSLQDLDRSMYLEEMIEAGITTFKIEGRLKDEDYVVNTVSYYRRLLDQYIATHPWYAPASEPFVGQLPPLPIGDKHRALEKTFHRGATDYFLHGRTMHMANWVTPKSTGEKIGSVVAVMGNRIRVQLDEGVQLEPGDGLCFGDDGCAVNQIEGNMVTTNKELDHSLPMPATLYRNQDTAYLKALRASRRVPVDILLRETDDGFLLRIGQAEQTFVYPHEPAKQSERAMACIREQLAKLGDTPFVARDITIESQPYFIPISILNSWRRQVIK